MRLILALAFLGQVCFVPAYGNVPVSVNVRPNTANLPGALTGLDAVPDYSLPEYGGRVRLQWAAPSAEGGADDVFSYVVKYATFSVTDVGGNTNTWWNHPNSLTALDPELPASWGLKARAARNNLESITLSGLINGKFYYFGVKSVDRYKRASDYDDPMKGITTQAASYATSPPWTPLNITTLTGLALSDRGKVNLQWVAPLFIDTSGVLVSGRINYAGEYCVQYSTMHNLTSGETITDVNPQFINKPDNPVNNWEASTRLFISTKNVTSGDLQSYVLTGLSLNTTYYFHVFARNDWPNKWSIASIASMVRPNIIFKPVVSITAVAGASASDSVASYINLSWTNPSAEPNMKGVRICYSTSTYPTSYTWPGYITSEPQITAQTTAYQHIQLLPRTSYFYTLYAYDNSGFMSDGVSTMTYTGADLIAPDTVQNLTGLIGAVASGNNYTYRINLNWTTPPAAPLYRNSDYAGAKIYFSTYTSVTALHNYLTTVTGANSEAQQHLHDNLQILTTYYYSVASVDKAGNESAARSPAMLYISEQYIPPSKPILLTAIGSSVPDINTGNNIYLRWTSPSEPQTSGVRVVLRTDRYATGVADIQNSALTYNWSGAANVTSNYTFKQLLTNTTYFIALFAESKYGLYSGATTSYITITVPWSDTLAPFEPQGVRIALVNAASRRLTWHAVEYNSDNTAFANAAAPRIDELLAYRIFRSTSMLGNDWYQVGMVMAGVNTFVDTLPDNRMYFYKVRSEDASGNYNDSHLLSSEGDVIITSNDGSYLWLPAELSRALNKEFNTYSSDIVIRFNNFQTEEVGPILKSVEWSAYTFTRANGAVTFSRIEGFNLAQAAKLTSESADLGLSYAVASSNSAISSAQKAVSRLSPEQITKQVALYYYNGVEWFKAGSKVNTETATVNTKVKFAGKYQLRLAAPATEFTFLGVLPKMITPNNDGQNDKALFRFANPKGSLVSIKIYDVKGALVRKLDDTNRSSDDQSGTGFIAWDGTDKDNQAVMPGVYIYQFEAEGKTVNGSIVVAR